jgi:hypothetical protein
VAATVPQWPADPTGIVSITSLINDAYVATVNDLAIRRHPCKRIAEAHDSDDSLVAKDVEGSSYEPRLTVRRHGVEENEAAEFDR